MRCVGNDELWHEAIQRLQEEELIVILSHAIITSLPARTSSSSMNDVFSGSFSAFLLPMRLLQEAELLASAGAVLSVTKIGAMNSAPHLLEIQNFLQQHNQPSFL
ncbi:hypothetical protein EDS67_20365 [candidate division KSB1 bacterium]|nr:MAG: hypothetical protein EDS67_20365 [candidate division KSB1 bacterium]MCE7943688.1 hypothetical protein [Chlorobi bacterium CHB1]